MLDTAENIRIQRIIIVIAFILFSVKLTAWLLTGSLAILTDALESIVNVVSAFLGLYSLALSARPKDTNHPYGHGKVEFISSAVEGTLIIIAGLLIIFKAVISFYHPHPIQKLDIGLFLLATSGVVNYLVGYKSEKTGKKNNSLPLIAEGKHLKTDTYSTIGIFIGLLLIHFTNFIWLDGVVACLFSLLIIYTGYNIIRSSVAGIMDEADITLLNNLVDSLNKNRNENWIDIHNLRFIKFGSRLHCDCHLTVPWYLNVDEAHEEIESLAKLIRIEFGETVELFVHADGCKDFSCSICKKENCQVRKHVFEKKIKWTVKNISEDARHNIFS